MADHLIHQRVFKVSKGLSRLDLLCEQHRRQIGHREGLPDWEKPHTPAGKASSRHARTPAFFAWDQEPEQSQQSTWQTETPQKVARTLEMTERESDQDAVLDRSPYARPSEGGCDSARREGRDEDAAIEVDDIEDRSSEEDQPVITGRSIAISPMREDILDRGPPPPPGAATAVPPRNPTLLPTVEVSPSPYRPPSSSRYRHGRRLEESDVAIPFPRVEPYAAGVTTEQADRYRMSKTSGKRFRSPAKRTTLWGDLCNSYIHQSSASSHSNMNTPSVSHKHQVRSAAERTFGGSSVFRTLNMDMYSWPRSESAHGQRQSVLTGHEAMHVANQAAREFLGGRDEESKRSEPPLQQIRSQQHSADGDRMGSISTGSEAFSAPRAGDRNGPKNYRKGKRVSFGGNNSVHLPNEVVSHPQPRTLPVLADKTTQTEESLLPARKQTRSDRFDASDRREVQGRDPGSPSRCSVYDTTMIDSERPRKVPRGSTDSAGAALAQQRNFRRTSSHLTNPIMINPRYPPEPSTFQGRSTYSTVFNDRLAWR